MTSNDLKQIGKLLEPIREDMRDLKKDVGGLKKDVKELKRVQKKHTRSLVNIENTIKIHGDMYDVNRYESRKLEQRIEVVEDEVGVEPPPELVLFN